MINYFELSPLVKSYLATALWSSNDESTPAGGEPFDRNYDLSDFAEQSVKEAKDDCDRFKKENEAFLGEAKDDGQIGHDFWLTRNGHGSGFWDGDYPIYGDVLTAACKSFGETTPYLGDDKKIYLS